MVMALKVPFSLRLSRTFCAVGLAACLLVARQLLGITPHEAIVASGDESKVGLVFIDPSVRGRQLLSFGPRKNSEVIVLAAKIPLLEQISSHLKGRRNVASIHIVSHGESGAVLTQGGRLDQNALATTSASTIAVIANALTVDADIFLYGCNIAKYGTGADFVRLLAERTGADIAASTNDTGHPSLGADWKLEYESGSIENAVVLADDFQQVWHDKLAIGISVASSTTTLLTALNPGGAVGVNYTGTASILGAFTSNAYGTFTTSGSNLGMTSGAVFGTGNISQVSGPPATFWDGAGTGNTAGAEFDRATLTFSFIPQAGVTKVAFRYVMGSEEYNEYVGQNFSDNITIRLNGGTYSNTNVATVPGTSTGIDIDTINASLNSSYYRDNTIASPPVPDSVLDGHTSLLKSISPVVPGTTYTAEIKVADFTDNRWNTALFVDYFGSSLQLDLDNNNSSGAIAANYATTFTEAGPAVAIADIDTSITNFDATSIQSAKITLTNAKPDDVLSYGSMPSGITATTNTSTPGVITITLTGSSTIANYQSAISSVLFSNNSNVPDTSQRLLDVVVNDGATNSNAASTSITFVSVPTYLYIVNKTANLSSVATPQDLTYTITVQNTGDGIMSGMNVSDVLTQGMSNSSITLTGPTGDGGATGQFEIGETWVYSATVPVTQAHIDNGNDLVNIVSVVSTQTNPVVQTAQVVTTITNSPSLSISKTADTAGPVNAGDLIGYTYTIANTGNITIKNISVNDVHNGTGPFSGPGFETQFTDVVPAGDSHDSTINGVWDSLAPGDSIRFTTSYVVTQADIDNGN
jgi:uncharacterized repeat protein (TIGR01451 family)